MQILLGKDFIEAMIRLPKMVQAKVMAFLDKIEENPMSAGLHIEPVEQFRDRSLRTARVDRGYRVVLGVIGSEALCLLYVDSHEAAYRWGTNRSCVWNDYTHTVQIVNVEEVKEEVRSPQSSPEEVRVFDGVGREKLLAIGVPEELVGRVESIRGEGDLEALASVLPSDVYESIFYYMCGEPIDSIIATIAEGKAAEGEDKLRSGNNRRNFVELTDDDALRRILEQGMEEWQIFLHPSQRVLVDSDYKGTMKVSGGAGTGKTVAALHRLKRLCEEPGARVLFTTYTKALSENLGEMIAKLEVPKQRYVLDNIDGLLGKMAKEYKLLGMADDETAIFDYYGGRECAVDLWKELLSKEDTAFTPEFLDDEYVSVILYFDNRSQGDYLSQQRIGREKSLSRKQRIEVWGLVEKYVALKRERKQVDRTELFNCVTKYLYDNGIHPFTNVIADEFQDFSNPELRFIRALVAKGRNDIFLTGDPLQRIYSGRRINFSAAGINVYGVRSRRLKVNYRTTEPIRRMAVSVVKGVEFDDMEGGKETLEGYVSLIHDGVAPQYRMVGSDKEEAEQVVAWLKECEESGIKLSEICIAASANSGLKTMETRLHSDGVAYRTIKGAKRDGDPEGVNLCTMHSLKGLEFRVVILIGVNEKSMPSKLTRGYPFFTMSEQQQQEYLVSRRTLLYMAMTRARQLVYIVGYGVPSGLLKETKE